MKPSLSLCAFAAALTLALAALPAALRAEETSKLDEVRVTLHLEQADLVEALKLLAEPHELSLIVHPDVARGKVTVDLKDVSLREALDAVAACVGARVVEEPYGVLRVVAAPTEGEDTALLLTIYEVQDLLGSHPDLWTRLRMIAPYGVRDSGGGQAIVRATRAQQDAIQAQLRAWRDAAAPSVPVLKDLPLVGPLEGRPGRSGDAATATPGEEALRQAIVELHAEVRALRAEVAELRRLLEERLPAGR